MEYKNAENTGNTPNVIVLLPFLVLVFCVYGDAADTCRPRALAAKSKVSRPPLPQATLNQTPLFMAPTGLPASSAVFSHNLFPLSKISGKVILFISRTVHPVGFIRGPPA